MTKVTFYKRNGVYYGFRETGHSGMSDGIGVDELCAGLSAMTMLVVNTIEVSFAGTVNYMYDPDTTDVQVISEDALPDSNADEKKRFAISGLIEGYYLQLSDMLEDYYDFLEVNETDDDPPADIR